MTQDLDKIALHQYSMTERRTHCCLHRYCHTSTSWNLALDQISLPLYLLSGQGIDVGLKRLTPGKCDPDMV